MGIKTATQINETEWNPDIHTCIYGQLILQQTCQAVLKSCINENTEEHTRA